MGASISKMMAKVFGSKEMRLLMLGLDAAGKTSMLPPLRAIAPIIANSPSYPIQAQARPRRNHHPHRRLQRRDRHIQEHQVQRMGRRWPGQDPSAMETLLLWYVGAWGLRFG
ncbi:ARF/SAR superfamily [Alternaria alternata]|nr:ARF/SAR superfamily [Alternaria alternata]